MTTKIKIGLNEIEVRHPLGTVVEVTKSLGRNILTLKELHGDQEFGLSTKERNALIRQRFREGEKQKVLAYDAGISVARVCQILKEDN